jgi:hypothetical protein
MLPLSPELLLPSYFVIWLKLNIEDIKILFALENYGLVFLTSENNFECHICYFIFYRLNGAG